jgi:hypothetical protein
MRDLLWNLADTIMRLIGEMLEPLGMGFPETNNHALNECIF